MKWLLLLTISMITVVSSSLKKEDIKKNANSSNVEKDKLPDAMPRI